MKRINTFNEIFTVLMFAIVTGLTMYGYISLNATASLGNVVHQVYGSYARYRSFDASIGKEVHASVAWAASPTSQNWKRAVSAQQSFDAALADMRGASPMDESRLTEIAAEHSRAVTQARLAARYFAAGNHKRAGVEYGATLRTYEALSDLAEADAQQRFDLGQSLNQKLQTLESRLEWTMVGIGVLGLVVTTGLSYTVRGIRQRAEVMTELKVQRLERAALSDSLTSLGNHRAFREDLAKEIARSRRHDHPMTLALLDIDDFKALNDSRGHTHGDDVLVQTARALRSGRLEDRAYRIGGDEFAIVLIETERNQAMRVLGRLRDNLKQRLGTATASVGFCQLESGFDEHDLYERADAALYAAKRNGRNTTVDFASIRDHTTIFSARKTIALQTLLDKRALRIAFQPIWNVTGKEILGFEALARPDDALGFKGPQEAFDLAERQRRVAELDRLCVDKVFEAAAGLPGKQLVFINVTPETLGRPDFQAKHLAAAALAAGLQPRQIAIELTERRITDAREVIGHVTELRDLGILIALDDTGVGSAGLEILSKFTFDFVKIDRSVVMAAMGHKRARAVLAGIVAIAREGGSFVIAEGVETSAQLAFLQDLRGASTLNAGITGVQGFLLGRPRTGRPNAETFASYASVLEVPPALQKRAAS